MYIEEDFDVVCNERSNILQDDCLAALGVAMMITQLNA